MRGTIRRVADATGLDQATVRRAITAAGLDPKGVSFEDASHLVQSIADTARVIGHAANGRGEGGYGAATDAFAEANAHAERLRARKIELQNAQLEGELISRKAVTETGARIIADVRTALLSLGYRLAEKVAGKTDVREIARISTLGNDPQVAAAGGCTMMKVGVVIDGRRSGHVRGAEGVARATGAPRRSIASRCG